MTREFSSLLKPRSVALFGPAEWCAGVIRSLRRMGFVWDIWPVVPGETTIEGVRAFASVERLPAAPDVAYIGLSDDLAVEAVAAFSARGAGVALCKGSADPEALARAAGGMRLLGPDCHGVVNAMERAAIWQGPQGLRPVKRGVAILARSASVAQSLTMQRRGLPIAFVAVTTPGPAQTRMALLGKALLEDERISALGLQAEDLGDPEAMIELAETAERLGKPVVVLRSGEQAGAAALIARCGMARVRSPEAFLEALKILHMMGAMPANGLMAVSFNGCAGHIVEDMGKARGLHFPPLSEPQKRALADDLGPGARLANPLDAHAASGKPVQRLARILGHAMSGRAVLTMLVLDHARSDRCDDDNWTPLVEAAAAARAQVGMPLALVSSLPEGMPERQAEALMAQGLIPLAGLSAAFEALRACIKLGGPARHPAPLLMPAFRPDGAAAADPAAARAMLAAQGLHVVPAGDDPAAPELRLHLRAQPSYGYVLRFLRGEKEVSGLLPLRNGETRLLLEMLGLPGDEIETVVPALVAMQDYVVAQKGAVDEMELAVRPGGSGAQALASGLRIRARGA